MALTIAARIAVLHSRLEQRVGVEIWSASVEDTSTQVVVYPEMIGPVAPGQRLLVNITAVALALGTGGQHFAIANLDVPFSIAEQPSRADGHILKLRYSPMQCRVLAAEEEQSPYHAQLCQDGRLPGTPVVCLGLHSQLAPVIGGIKAQLPEARIAYLMTDSAALSLAFSRQVALLRETGHLAITITAGQAFGGELEAVNIYSGMVMAQSVGHADIIIAGQGPGNVGTGTPLGFGGIDQAQLLNAAGALGGKPIAVPRISFADSRARHHGISHHTMTVLGLTLIPAFLPIPQLLAAEMEVIKTQLAGAELSQHQITYLAGDDGINFCESHCLPLHSMGRGYADDAAFFLAASAAGSFAGELIKDTPEVASL